MSENKAKEIAKKSWKDKIFGNMGQSEEERKKKYNIGTLPPKKEKKEDK